MVLRKKFLKFGIEGHTSSEWNDLVSIKDAYFYNLKLSQERSREVAVFSLSLPMEEPLYSWAAELLLAAGMSSSKPIFFEGVENILESRRVEFRVRTNAEEKLTEIVNERSR